MISETARAEAQADSRQRKWARRAGRLAGALALLAVGALLALVLATMVAPHLLGYQTYVIYGSSMEPTIKVGSLIAAKPADINDLQVDDIVVFRSPGNETTLTHRIVEIQEEDGQRHFKTKGDASNGADPLEVSLEGGAQQVYYVVPYLGYFVHFAKSTTGIILLIVLPGIGQLALQLTQGKRETTNAKALREGENLSKG